MKLTGKNKYNQLTFNINNVTNYNLKLIARKVLSS